MTNKFRLLAAGAVSLLSLGLSQAVLAHDYDEDRTERQLREERAERNRYAHAEHEAREDGDYARARIYDWRRRHEQNEINELKERQSRY